MTTLRLELDVRPSAADVARLRADLAPYASLNDAAESLDLAAAAFFVSFFADALQGVDVLLAWIKGLRARNPQMHTASLRLADGRTFEVQTTDEDALRAALLAVLNTP